MIQRIESTLKSVLRDHLRAGEPFNFAKAIMIACNAVEVYSAHIEQLHGNDKREAAYALVPLVVAESVNEGYITKDQGEHLQGFIQTADAVIFGIIDAYVAISHNPHFLQLKSRVKKRCETCLPRARPRHGAVLRMPAAHNP